MLDRAACERRVYRLATLLTGDASRATRTIAAVVGARPDLRLLDSAHLDRLTVLRSREIAPGGWDGAKLPASWREMFRSLSLQQREAWVLNHVYRLQPRDVAKAMDCSVRAVALHLSSAETALREGLAEEGAATSLAKHLLQYSHTLEVPAFYRAAQRRRRRWRRLRRVVIAIAAVVAIAAIVLALERLGVFEGIIRSGAATDPLEDHASPTGGQ